MKKIFDDELISRTNSITIFGDERSEKNVLVKELIEFLGWKHLKISSGIFRGKLTLKNSEEEIYFRDFLQCQKEINSIDDRLIVVLEEMTLLESITGFNSWLEKILNEPEKMVVMLRESGYPKHFETENVIIYCEYCQKIFCYLSINLEDIRKSNRHNFIRIKTVKINDYSVYQEGKLIKQVQDNSDCPNLSGQLADKFLRIILPINSFLSDINTLLVLTWQNFNSQKKITKNEEKR